MLLNGGRRYLARTGTELMEVGSSLGTPYLLSGQWYLTIGNTLFQVLL
jgi:hypothetical protein